MAVTAAEILVRIVADTNPLTKGLVDAKNKTAQFSKNLESFGRSVSSAGNRLTLGLTLPILAFGKAAVSEFEGARSAMRQTNAVLTSTGNVANVTRKGLEALTDAVAKNAAVDNDLIRQGANMILTFTNIRNEAGAGNDIFNQTVSVLTDVAAAMAAASGGEMDLKGTAIQLGKALNDPVKGITALTRVGVSFTKQQTDQIKALVKSGKTLDAQKMILAELTREFGGSAKANATASMRLKAAFQDLSESIGKQIYPLVKQLTRAITELISGFKGLTPEMQRTVLKALAFSAALGPILKIVGPLLRVAGAFGMIATNAAAAAKAASGISAATNVGGAAAGAVGGMTTAVITAFVAAVLLAVKAWYDHKTALKSDIERLRAHGGSIRNVTMQSREMVGSFRDVSLNQSRLNELLVTYRQQQTAIIGQFTFVTAGLKSYATELLTNNLLTERQSARIAALISGMDRMGGGVDALTLKQASNLIAVGDVTGAMQLLRQAAKDAAQYLGSIPGALENPRNGMQTPQGPRVITSTSTPTLNVNLVIDRLTFSRKAELSLRASGL